MLEPLEPGKFVGKCSECGEDISSDDWYYFFNPKYLFCRICGHPPEKEH